MNYDGHTRSICNKGCRLGDHSYNSWSAVRYDDSRVECSLREITMRGGEHMARAFSMGEGADRQKARMRCQHRRRPVGTTTRAPPKPLRRLGDLEQPWWPAPRVLGHSVFKKKNFPHQNQLRGTGFPLAQG